MIVNNLLVPPIEGLVSIMIMIATLYILLNILLIFRGPAIVKLIFLFGIFVFISNILHESDITKYVSLLWILAFLSSYIFSFQSPSFSNKIIQIASFIIVPLLAALYLKAAIVFGYNRVASINDASFVLLVLLPFVMSVKKSIFKNLLLIGIGILSFLSLKRSSILAFSIALLIYFFFIYFKQSSGKNKPIAFIIILISISGLFISFNYIDQLVGGTISDRMSSMREDEGSGRLKIYELTYTQFKESSDTEMFFGHGTESTNEILGRQAHNDILTVLFEYGLLGLIFFLSIYYNLVAYSFRRIRSYKMQNLDVAYVASISIFVVIGMLNCFINNSYYFTTLMIFIGISVGRFKNSYIHNRS